MPLWILLLIPLLIVILSIFFGFGCLLSLVLRINTCVVSPDWIVSVFVICVLCTIPVSIIVNTVLKLRRNQNRKSSIKGYVRPSLLNNAIEEPSGVSPSRRVLLAKTIAGSMADSFLELLFGVLVVRTGNFRIASLIVIASSVGSVVFSSRGAYQLSHVRSYNPILFSLIIERAAVFASVLVLMSPIQNETIPSLFVSPMTLDYRRIFQIPARPATIISEYDTFQSTLLVALCATGSTFRNIGLILRKKLLVSTIAISPLHVSPNFSLQNERPQYNRSPALSGNGLATGMGSNRMSMIDSDSESDRLRLASISTYAERRKESQNRLSNELETHHIMTRIVSLVLVGYIMDNVNPKFDFIIPCLGFFIVHFVSLCIQAGAVLLIYSLEPDLREGPVSFGTSWDPYYNPGSQYESIYRPLAKFDAFFEDLRSWAKSWKLYATSPIFLASVGSCCLYATILNGGLITVGYLKWMHVPCTVLGLVIGVQQVSCGILQCADRLHRSTQSLAKTATRMLWIAFICSITLAIIFFHLAENASSLWICVAALLVSLPAAVIRVFMVLHQKLLKEWVDSDYLHAVLRRETNLKLAGVVMIHFVVYASPSLTAYPFYIVCSLISLSFGTCLYYGWYKYFDCGTPYQIVNELGQLNDNNE